MRNAIPDQQASYAAETFYKRRSASSLNFLTTVLFRRSR